MHSFPILELLQDCEDPPLTPEGLEELEIELGVRLPKEYADFLLEFNGGEFRPWVAFYLPNPTQWADWALVRSFIGEPGDRVKYGGLVWSAQMLRDRLPEEYLAIAECNGQDFVLLKFAGPKSEFAGVWYFDSSGFWIPESGDSIHWVADSFNEFLSMLLVDVEDEREEHETIPLFRAVERGNRRAVEQFLSQGGAVETRNAQGQTLLAAAAIFSWPKIVRLLLEHSADQNARDDQ